MSIPPLPSQIVTDVRLTRSELEARATAGRLRPGQGFIMTDQARFAVALTPTTFQAFSKEDEGGLAAWTPIIAYVPDGARRVAQIVDWVGGGGTKPEVGDYIGPDGFTDDISEATDVRGPEGSGVEGPDESTVGYVPVWDNTLGTKVSDGRAIGAASDDDLLDRASGDVRYQPVGDYQPAGDYQETSEKDQADGYAGLDAEGLLDPAQIPDLDYVAGPEESTDGFLAVFDGETGKLIKEGPAIGAGADTDVLDRLSADGRYLQPSDLPAWRVMTETGAAVDGDMILADTSGGGFTITLPEYGQVTIRDAAQNFGEDHVTVVPAEDGSIMSVPDDELILNQTGEFRFVADDGSPFTVTRAQGAVA